MKQLSPLSGRVNDLKVAVGVQLENPAVAVVDLAIAPDRQAERALAEAVVVLVALVALNVPMVKEAHAQGHHKDRVAKAGKQERTARGITSPKR